MKTLKGKIVAVGSALTLFFGIAVTVHAIDKGKSIVETGAKTLQTWYFNPTEPTHNPDLAQNYSLIAPPGVSCGGDSETICSIQDIADASNSQPNMTHGDVSDDSTDKYEKSYRDE
ncbi:MAG: hypothetical protein LBF27_05755 [Sphingobacterium sp.]|jgi:hypothetical protein|nr:hypothetical protein [Sphingobacterium sp.]